MRKELAEEQFHAADMERKALLAQQEMDELKGAQKQTRDPLPTQPGADTTRLDETKGTQGLAPEEADAFALAVQIQEDREREQTDS